MVKLFGDDRVDVDHLTLHLPVVLVPFAFISVLFLWVIYLQSGYVQPSEGDAFQLGAVGM